MEVLWLFPRLSKLGKKLPNAFEGVGGGGGGGGGRVPNPVTRPVFHKLKHAATHVQIAERGKLVSIKPCSRDLEKKKSQPKFNPLKLCKVRKTKEERSILQLVFIWDLLDYFYLIILSFLLQSWLDWCVLSNKSRAIVLHMVNTLKLSLEIKFLCKWRISGNDSAVVQGVTLRPDM